ncbi:MAG: hypothetical protein RR855_11200 [Comamonas sp.]
MQWVLEDSEVAAWNVAPGAVERLTVRFSAARVYDASGGKTGNGAGMWLPLLLICELSECLQQTQQPFGRLESGRVWLDGKRLSALPVPCVLQQPLVLELEFASGVHCRVPARALEVRPVATHCATGSFQC